MNEHLAGPNINITNGQVKSGCYVWGLDVGGSQNSIAAQYIFP